AIQKLGLTRKVYVGSFDLSPGFLQDLASGTATFALDQQPFLQGYLSVVLMANYARYGVIPTVYDMATGPEFVTQKDAKQVIALAKQGIR
ncbi:MAG TPA: LacI family transcriptional regulator, partial [Acetobacteraceae bacterium]|nr:LacI family transcriptional regulator [Acetobacteraceae bacterium]